MTVDLDRYRIAPGEPLRLAGRDPADTQGLSEDRDEDRVDAQVEANLERMDDLQERLYAERAQSLLVILQAMDGAGKDSTIEHVLGRLNPQGVRVWNFGTPTEKELAHDFLWRIHKRTPGAGYIGVFNRSHYEDVLIVRVKSLAPPPEKWSGLADPELRYRKRYLDLMVHAEVRERFEQRSQVLTTIRHYLEAERFLEVETPMMHPVPGGARARPFITHHNALGMNLYLRIAPELYLKRLLVGGFERVFEVNRNFRNEGIDHTHNPEFTMLELYEAYADYERMMELTEGMIVAAAKALRGNDELSFEWNGHKIDLTPPFRRAKYADLFREATGFDMTEREKVAAEAKKQAPDQKGLVKPRPSDDPPPGFLPSPA